MDMQFVRYLQQEVTKSNVIAVGNQVIVWYDLPHDEQYKVTYTEEGEAESIQRVGETKIVYLQETQS